MKLDCFEEVKRLTSEMVAGHIDTVGVDDFGTIREYAFKTDELPQKLKETFSLAPEVLADIESGDYMFGRGALDMKSGVAGHMYLVKYFSEHPEELDGNLVQIAECDEEDNSHGIITAIDYLLDLKKKEHFEYVACINADYSTNYMPGDENRYIYYGSIGKLLPCFVALGKESHVGSAFNAFDPNLLIAEVTGRGGHPAHLSEAGGHQGGLHRPDGADRLLLLQLLHPRHEPRRGAGKEPSGGCGRLRQRGGLPQRTV